MKPLGNPPYICLITPGRANPLNYESEKLAMLENVREAISRGVGLVQIREKHLPTRLLFDLAEHVVAVARESETVIVVNDRADIAIAAGADGVHLTEKSMPADIIRGAFPRELVIGVSTHSLEKAQSAATFGADYVFFGPVFEAPGKGEPAGLGSLRNVCQRLRDFPVIALGGIDANNVAEIFRSGAAGVAAIRAMSTPQAMRDLMTTVSGLDIRLD